MENPFDPRTVLFAKHAQHVVLVHFPIGLCLTSVIFELLGKWRANAALISASYYNQLAAAIASVPVVATGLLAWQFQLEGAKLKGNLLMHLVFGSIASLLMWSVVVLYRRSDATGIRLRYGVQFLTAIVISITGHLGGFVSGVNGGQ
ncbi:MAG TPA: DUF2231 domain-containing protein [Candidatus Dormibacteraeota bacterium]|jgi:uncharacterized membrane protein|nr:DUF2231 domain-containing protein [Candidatus Dormibacteraeota bacterium]